MRFGANVLGALFLAAFCAVRIATSDTSIGVSQYISADARTHEIAKADVIDDIIDIITGGTKPPPPPPTDP